MMVGIKQRAACGVSGTKNKSGILGAGETVAGVSAEPLFAASTLGSIPIGGSMRERGGRSTN